MPPRCGCGSGTSPRWPWDPSTSRSLCPTPSPGSTSRHVSKRPSRPPYARSSRARLLYVWSSTSEARHSETGSRHNTAKFSTLSLLYFRSFLCCSCFLSLRPVHCHLSCIIDIYRPDSPVGSSGTLGDGPCGSRSKAPKARESPVSSGPIGTPTNTAEGSQRGLQRRERGLWERSAYRWAHRPVEVWRSTEDRGRAPAIVPQAGILSPGHALAHSQEIRG